MLTDHVSEWARPYDLPVRTVDGNDVDSVHKAAKEAVAYIRENRKPYFLETYTYRTRGHMEPDDQAYVNKAELAWWKQKDPIAMQEALLLQSGLATRDELEAIEARVRQTIEDAAAFALASPYPSFDELTTDVYA
jgi:TPP-dependent pyruvate/acetoin dehydrogenase alpha subunit